MINNMGTVILETERLILRRFKLEDADGMYNNWATDPNCNKYVTWNLHESVEMTSKVIEMWINEYEKNSYNWVVELKENNEIIGSITAVKFSEKDLNCEIGYCYGSKYWNNGYATEALKRVIDFFLNEVGLYLVEARHISGNPASGRVMQKSGMHQDAVLKSRKMNKVTKELNDLIVYSICKDDK